MSVFATLHRIADEVPTPAVIAAGLTVPWWREWLLAFSELLTVFAQVVAAAIAVYKLWDAYKTSKGRADAAAATATAIGTAAKKSSLASGSVIGFAAALLGVFAITSWLSHAKADPIKPVAVSTSKAGRKRSTDHAGDDETDESADTFEGAPAWLDEAAKHRGIKEKIGRRSNPVIVGWYAICGASEVRNTDTPWCKAFTAAMLHSAGIKSPPGLMARSYLNWGVELDTPRMGCVVVMWRGERDNGVLGHVGFYVGETATHVKVLGGNQGDSVNVALFPKRRVLSYRWPRSLAKSKTVQAAVAVKAAATGAGGALATVASELPEPAKPTTADKIAQGVETVKGPLEQVQSALPHGAKLAVYIGIACCVLTFVGAGIVLYQRWAIQDRSGV